MAISVSDLMIRKTSVQLNIEEDLVDRVVRHQWRTTLENLTSQREVEVSGFCKFKVRTHNIIKHIKKLREYIEREIPKLNDPLLTGDQLRKFNLRLDSNFDELNYLMSKLTEDEQNNANIRGLEESLSTSRGAQGTNRDSIQGEIRDL